MTKWGDLLISAVAYDQKHRITFVKQHKDTEDSIGEGEIINATSLASSIKNGKSCVTIYSTLSNWKLGETLRTYNLDGDYFIRNDKSKVKSDNLGNLLELRVSDMGEEIPEAPSLEEKPKPAPKPAANAPPKVPPKPLPTPKLEEAPEPKPAPTPKLEEAPEPKPAPTPKPEKAPEPKPAPTPKPVVEESASKVKSIPKSKKGLDNKIEQLKELSDQLSELKQDVEKIEKPKKGLGEPSTEQGIQVEAYCVKCKSKRTIKDPFETTLKNGRSAIKGKCVKCGSKVCRMGKISKK